MTRRHPKQGEEPERLLDQLRSQVAGVFHGHFERVFAVSVLITILFIVYFGEHRLSLLGLFFLPVILSGYYLNTRLAVLGGVLAILIVGFFLLIRPVAFMHEEPGRAPYFHLLVWGSCLILSGALTGKLNEGLRSQFSKASRTLERLNEIQDELADRHHELESTNITLAQAKNRLESILHYTMDPAVAQLIIQHQLKNETREITVLFADLENFTANVEGIPPQFIIHNLNRLFGDIEPILSRFRGHLDKYLGDGFMAEFGVPFMAKQHPVLAVASALQIQDYLRRNSPWKMRIGIANGLSLVGLVGSDKRKNYTAIGDIVNLADRLQKFCPPGSVCVDRNTYRQVTRWCRTRPLRRPLTNEDKELFERAQSTLDPARQEAVEEAMVKAFLKEEEAGYVAIKGRQEQVPIYEVLGFVDPLENYWRVPPEAVKIYKKLRPMISTTVADDCQLTLEILQGSLGHGQVTAALSLAIAERMGLDDQTQKDLLIAASFHDIGKLSLPERLLSDNRLLADWPLADQELMRGHVMATEKVLQELNVPASPQALEGIRQHHERFDGSGYPEGLKGEQISILARIIQLADQYECMTSWRPYRDKKDVPAALAEFRTEVVEGKFDPKIGEVFLKMLDSSIGIS